MTSRVDDGSGTLGFSSYLLVKVQYVFVAINIVAMCQLASVDK